MHVKCQINSFQIVVVLLMKEYSSKEQLPFSDSYSSVLSSWSSLKLNWCDPCSVDMSISKSESGAGIIS